MTAGTSASLREIKPHLVARKAEVLSREKRLARHLKGIERKSKEERKKLRENANKRKRVS